MKIERTMKRIVNNTFEKIDAFSGLIIIFEIFKKKKGKKDRFRSMVRALLQRTLKNYAL